MTTKTIALKTKANRREFTSLYGVDTRNVVKHIVRGWDTQRIANKVGVPRATVAAYRANVTRGTYVPFIQMNANGIFTGTCRF